MSARGWCCYTSRGQTAGDRLADSLYQAAALWLPGHQLRKDYSDGDPDWESDFYILKNTLCAAALTENLFHDNPDDVRFVASHAPTYKEFVLNMDEKMQTPEFLGDTTDLLNRCWNTTRKLPGNEFVTKSSPNCFFISGHGVHNSSLKSKY